MDPNKSLDLARKLATRAKPGIIKIHGKTYTFVFDQNRWVYRVYEDLVWLMDYNTKSLATAKKWLQEYLEN